MNDYRKIAKFVSENELTVQEFKVTGTSGGYDDFAGLEFYKRNELLYRWTTKGFNAKKTSISVVLESLQEALEEFKTIGVSDEETLERYLLRYFKAEKPLA